MSTFSRRELITGLRNVLLSAAGAPFLLPSRLRAEGDDHYFIFVELKGGAHHMLSTDYPYPQELAKIEQQYPDAIMHFSPDIEGVSKLGFMVDDGLTEAWKTKIIVGVDNGNRLFKLNAYCLALPHLIRNGQRIVMYREGTTQGNRYRYCLGWSGLPLAGLVDEISVVRSVSMLGDFHGRANVEIYSGHPDNLGPHVAGVLSQRLAEQYGNKPLDNLVIDGASYADADNSNAAIKLSWQALGALASNIDKNSSGNFSHMRVVANSLLQQDDLLLSAASRIRIAQYVQALAKANLVRDGLSQAGVNKGDLSLDLRSQLDSCLALFRTGMSRVITVCTGSRNQTNQVDSFGLFDAHKGAYHRVEGSGRNSSQHYLILRKTMQAIVDFIADLKHNPQHASYRDKVTVVIGSEFGRTANFAGNENSPKKDQTWLGAVGNGHYYFNNNYLFFGKGVSRGVWLGESDTITRFPYCVDFAKLNSGDANAYLDPIAMSSRVPRDDGLIALREGFTAGLISNRRVFGALQEAVRKIDTSRQRAFMAKDIVKTIMAMAGQDSDVFHQHYGNSFYDDAETILPLVG